MLKCIRKKIKSLLKLEEDDHPKSFKKFNKISMHLEFLPNFILFKNAVKNRDSHN